MPKFNAYDFDALLAFHKAQFGNATMTAPDTTAAPTDAPPAGPDGVWGQGVVPPAGPASVPAPTHTLPPRDAATGQFTAEQLEAARREERDKLYKRLEVIPALETELGALKKEREEREKVAADAAAAATAAEEAKRLSEMSAAERIEAINQSWEQRFTALQESQATQNAVHEQERRFNAVQSYKDRRLGEESSLIHPTLLDLVTGSTEAEVEASITLVKAKTDAIVQDIAAHQVAQRQAMPGVAPTGAPPVGPMDQTSGQQTYSAADIAAMDPATYAKHRTSLMQAASQKARDGGLYS